jgi:phage tail-like protein
MAISDENMPSKLLDYLPDIYRDEEHPFLSQYLAAFEKILIGRDDGVKIPAEEEGASSTSLEETIARIATLFDPFSTPVDFLPWLASWAALSLRADLDEKTQRSFISNIIQLYRRRGTKDNLIKLLQIFTGIAPTVDENATPTKPGARGEAHFFRVSILLANPTPEEVNRQRAIARSLIDSEKPAYTYYELEMNFAGLRLGDYEDQGKTDYHATIDIDTFIGIVPADAQ